MWQDVFRECGHCAGLTCDPCSSLAWDSFHGSGSVAHHPLPVVLKSSIIWVVLGFVSPDQCPGDGPWFVSLRLKKKKKCVAGSTLINAPALSQFSQPGHSEACHPWSVGTGVLPALPRADYVRGS